MLEYILLLLSSVTSHSWVDCITRADIDYQGPDQLGGDSLFSNCIGYPRGYPGREDPEINTIYTTLISNRGKFGEKSVPTPICGTRTQVTINYPSKFPMGKVHAGSELKIWYTMNGHRSPYSNVSLHGYGETGREIKWYTEINKSNELYNVTFASPDNCRNTDNDNTLCWNDWTVPTNWKSGIYSLVWFWKWDSNKVGEEYTTCMELEVIPGNPNNGKKHILGAGREIIQRINPAISNIPEKIEIQNQIQNFNINSVNPKNHTKPCTQRPKNHSSKKENKIHLIAPGNLIVQNHEEKTNKIHKEIEKNLPQRNFDDLPKKILSLHQDLIFTPPGSALTENFNEEPISQPIINKEPISQSIINKEHISQPILKEESALSQFINEKVNFDITNENDHPAFTLTSDDEAFQVSISPSINNDYSEPETTWLQSPINNQLNSYSAHSKHYVFAPNNIATQTHNAVSHKKRHTQQNNVLEVPTLIINDHLTQIQDHPAKFNPVKKCHPRHF